MLRLLLNKHSEITKKFATIQRLRQWSSRRLNVCDEAVCICICVCVCLCSSDDKHRNDIDTESKQIAASIVRFSATAFMTLQPYYSALDSARACQGRIHPPAPTTAPVKSASLRPNNTPPPHNESRRGLGTCPPLASPLLAGLEHLSEQVRRRLP